MIDIFCKDKKCPICDKEMIDKGVYFTIIYCESNCYYYFKGGVSETFEVFDDEFYTRNSRLTDNSETYNEVKEKIKYWKENERYLMKILEGD